MKLLNPAMAMLKNGFCSTKKGIIKKIHVEDINVRPKLEMVAENLAELNAP